MDRKQFLTNLSMIGLASFLPTKSLWAQRLNSLKTIRRNVGYFTGNGGTIGWLASSDALVVVDSQESESARQCLNELQGRTNHTMDLFINTHHHGDHTGGNEVFEPVAERMIAHDRVPDLMRQQSADDDPEPVLPKDTYESSWNLEVGDESVHLKHYGPAHTGGDTVVYFEKANVVHMGDLVFKQMNPFTDRPGGASAYNWISVLEEVAGEYPTDAVYIFGHSKPEVDITGSADDLEVMRSYLSAMVEHVEEGIESGVSKEKITDLEKMEGFEDFLYADFWSLSQNLEVIYEEAMER